MANASKKTGTQQRGAEEPSQSENELPFEEALKKLEGIVEEMEQQELPLEKLLARYEEGTRLAKACQKKLSEAELKIQQLEKGSNGETTLKPLSSSADDTSDE